MSEKGPISRRLDNRKLKKSNETRIHDPAKAVEMAYAEKPHRERAIQQRKVGKALVGQVWANYPNFDRSKVVTASEIADRINGEISEADITAHNREGIADLRKRIANRTATSERSAERRQAKVNALVQVDPSAIPNNLAQGVGYELQDTTARQSDAAADMAAEAAGVAYDQAQADSKRLFEESFDRAHGISQNSRPPM